MKKSWSQDVAQVWTKVVGPSRPTVSELSVYTKYTHELQNKLNRRLDILILGSTPEFRDWAYEERMNVTIIDFSLDYHKKISREIKHKNILEINDKEKLVVKKWEDMNFEQEFDIVIGDLAIGNVEPKKLEIFISNVANALRKDGLFLGKSFFKPEDYKPILHGQLANEYYSKNRGYHPYSYFVFDLVMNCLDENNMLCFKDLYNEVVSLKTNGLITDTEMECFENIGWDTEMKFVFHVPNIKDYESIINRYMKIEKIEYGMDVYSKNFPLYIIRK